MDNNFFINCIDLHSEFSYGVCLSKGEKYYKKWYCTKERKK